MAHQAARLKPNDGSGVWLPAGIVVCIVRFLSANEIACTARLVDKATSQHFASHKTVRLSLPSPTHIFKQRWGRDSFRAYTMKQRLKLMCLTAASGSIANLEIALDNAGLCVQGWRGSTLLEAAAAAGQLDVCKMLRARGCPWGGSLAAAAGGGHRHVCEWMLDSGCSLWSSAVDAAARGGDEDLVIWLLRLFREGNAGGVVDVGELLDAAATGLGLAAFQRLHQQLLAGQQQGGEAQQQPQQEEVISLSEREGILAAAAASPTPDWRAKVEWLEGQGYPRTGWACCKAASCSPDEEAVSRLQWLCSRGYTPDRVAGKEAASHGNLAALCFLMEQVGGPGIQDSKYEVIARGGHLAVLQYLATIDFTIGAWSRQVAKGAAEMGHLPVVAWAVEVLGVTPDNTVNLLDDAAVSGSVELMTWLRERGWTWCWGTIANAVESGCEEAVEWLVEQGCPWKVDGVLQVDGEAYTRAATNGDLAMICCLHRLGCPWGLPGRVLADSIRNRHSTPVPVLRFLVALGCPVDDWDAAVRVAERTATPWQPNRTALLAWLAEEWQRRSLGAQQ